MKQQQRDQDRSKPSPSLSSSDLIYFGAKCYNDNSGQPLLSKEIFAKGHEVLLQNLKLLLEQIKESEHQKEHDPLAVFEELSIFDIDLLSSLHEKEIYNILEMKDESQIKQMVNSPQGQR